MRIDVSLLPALAAAFMLAFARVGAMVMLLPGLGETSIPTRVKLLVAARAIRQSLQEHGDARKLGTA